MLPVAHRIAFAVFAVIASVAGSIGFLRVIHRIRRGQPAAEFRFRRPFRRLAYALRTTLTQSRTFRKRPVVSLLHSFIFYGFVFYVLVNLVDGLEGYLPFVIRSTSWPGAAFNLSADLLSFLVLLGVIGLVFRRFYSPARGDFTFNARTLLHPRLAAGAVSRDSIIVSAFIVIHVASRAIESAAQLRIDGRSPFQPFASVLSYLIPQQNAEAFHIFGYWGALGSVLVFLSYFAFSKHIHIFAAPAKYFVAREPNSGQLPLVKVDLEDVSLTIGAGRIDDLAWPRLLDAYACIQCNRCQDVCPATATGKALSPAALEINKRMELNGPDRTGASANLLKLVISPEALWACTTCGACMEVCPVQDEQMLDIIDIRRNQVMMEGQFPSQLQSAFRGMERAKNPWGINHEQRMDWAQGLKVKTVDENPEPDVLYWVGCAASYDPQAQKTARAFVQLMDRANVDCAVLGKKECCTGDSARRAGNEYLYQQLATENISTLNALRPRTIVATCPHCFNALGNEYGQLGGNYTVMHHTEFLDSLVASGRLPHPTASATITYHDPCYLGRHNGVYDAPRNLLRILGQEFIEMGRNRENSFCCGAGGAQFWKEEEPGDERISDNRYREAEQTLGGAAGVLAVGCPFCKSMLDSTPGKGAGGSLVVKDIAELMLEGLSPPLSTKPAAVDSELLTANVGTPAAEQSASPPHTAPAVAQYPTPYQTAASADTPSSGPELPDLAPAPPVARKAWTPKSKQTPPD